MIDLHIAKSSGHFLAFITSDYSAAFDKTVHSFHSEAGFSGFLTPQCPVFLFLDSQTCNFSLSEHNSRPSSSVYLHFSIRLFNLFFGFKSHLHDDNFQMYIISPDWPLSKDSCMQLSSRLIRVVVLWDPDN